MDAIETRVNVNVMLYVLTEILFLIYWLSYIMYPTPHNLHGYKLYCELAASMILIIIKKMKTLVFRSCELET